LEIRRSPRTLNFLSQHFNEKLMNLLHELRTRFLTALAPLTETPEQFVSMIRPAQDAKFGDFQANCAMPLAKKQGQNPRDIAQQILDNLNVADLCTEPEIAGPGFINLRLRDDLIIEQTTKLIADERLGVSVVLEPKNYVIDYSAPNVAKPMHVGHLRSSVIGNANYNILKFLGHNVISDNHIGDWGTQFGMIIFGYKNFLDSNAFKENSVSELARLYRLVSQLSDYHDTVTNFSTLEMRLSEAQVTLENSDQDDKSAKKKLKKLRSEIASIQSAISSSKAKIEAVEADATLLAQAKQFPEIAHLAREETAKLHSGDSENKALWEQFLPECLHALTSVYDRLNLQFDHSLGESYYQPMLADVVHDLNEKGLAKESEGAMCVFLDDNAAPFIVQKTDGAFTYATTDLATIKYRVEEFQADSILYVVDARQSEHFKLLFETAKQWGFDNTEFRHVSFGTILGDDKRPFKTRSGDTVGLESLLDEAVTRARAIVDANDDSKETPELDEQARAAVAEVVGIGGIKYADLHHNRESDYVFNWDKMLAVTGDTATYMQYAYARICGIFRKGNVDRESLRNEEISIDTFAPAERALALKVLRFVEALEDVSFDFRPNILTTYLFETANCFSTFYNECPVLKEENENLRQTRLVLCDLTARVIKQGLELLGIETCERL